MGNGRGISRKKWLGEFSSLFYSIFVPSFWLFQHCLRWLNLLGRVRGCGVTFPPRGRCGFRRRLLSSSVAFHLGSVVVSGAVPSSVYQLLVLKLILLVCVCGCRGAFPLHGRYAFPWRLRPLSGVCRHVVISTGFYQSFDVVVVLGQCPLRHRRLDC